jgi:hypothetical protein
MDTNFLARHSFTYFFLFGFAFFSLFLFSGWTDPGIAACSLNLLVIGVSAFRSLKGGSTWLHFLSIVFLLISLLLSGLPFDSGNPFDFFRYPVFQNLFSWIPAFASLYVAKGLTEKGRLSFHFWMPLLFLVGINAWFVLLDYREIPAFDSSRHLMNALQIYESVSGTSGMKLWEVLMHYDFYQPIAYIAPAPFFFLFGKSYTSALLCQVFFWLPLAFLGAWRTLRFLRFSGAIAAFTSLVLFAGAMSFSLLRHFMQDFPVLTQAIWFQYYVLRSGFFKRGPDSWKAGWVFAAGVLTKASFLFFLPGVLVFMVIQFFRKPFSPVRLNHAENLLKLAVPVVMLVGAWFLVNRAHYNYTLPSMKNFAALNKLENAEELAAWHWYWPRIPKAGSLGLVLLFLGSVVWLFRKPKGWNLALSGAMGFFIAVSVLGFIPNKDVRTIFPLQAFFILPVAVLLRQLPNLVTTGVYGIGLPSVFVLGFFLTQGWNWWGPEILKPIPFMVETKPMPPSSPCPNHSWFLYEKIYQSVFQGEEVPRLQFEESDNFHSRASYSLLLKGKELSTHSFDHKQGEVLAFTRSAAWPDHYFWRLFVQDSSLVLQQLGREEQIDGDLQIELYWLDAQDKGLKQEILPLEPGKIQWKWPVLPGAQKVRYAWKMHYTHPKGQWVQLVYDLLKEPSFQTFNVPLQIFQSKGSPTETLVMPLMEEPQIPQ